MTSELTLRTALEPTTLDEAARLAKAACASRLYQVQSAEAALMILLTGRDLGLSASQSLRAIYVVSGKPVVSADALVAAVRRSGLCESWRTIESTAERCTLETRRKGEEHPERETFTIEDAKRAKLDGKDVWRAYPRDMLRHRCAAGLVRRVYPDVALGCYTPGELDDPMPANVSNRTPSAPVEEDAIEDAESEEIREPAKIDRELAEAMAEHKYQGGPSAPQTPAAEGRDPLSTENARAFVELLTATNSTDGVVAAWLRYGHAFASEGSDVLRACFNEGVSAYVAYGGAGRAEFEAEIKRARASENAAPAEADTKPRTKSRKSAAAPLASAIDHVDMPAWAAHIEVTNSKWAIATGFHKRSDIWRAEGTIARARGITIDRLCAVMCTDDLDAARFLDGNEPVRRTERRAAMTERRPTR